MVKSNASVLTTDNWLLATAFQRAFPALHTGCGQRGHYHSGLILLWYSAKPIERKCTDHIATKLNIFPKTEQHIQLHSGS